MALDDRLGCADRIAGSLAGGGKTRKITLLA